MHGAVQKETKEENQCVPVVVMGSAVSRCCIKRAIGWVAEKKEKAELDRQHNWQVKAESSWKGRDGDGEERGQELLLEPGDCDV